MQIKNQRVKYLAKNTLIFTLGNLATKLISFFLVPLYTNVMTTSEYGTVDLINTVCGVLAPVLILDINESIMRFCLDKDKEYEDVLRVGVVIYACALIVGLLIFPVNTLFSETSPYSKFIYLYTIASAGSQLFLGYLRGKENLVGYSVGSVIQTFSTAILNIVFLLYFHKGVNGYLLAMILASTITMVYAIIVGQAWKVFTNFTLNKDLAKQMIKYSVVLIPNTFMWWIMNASDRMMVTAMVGVAANGVYAISYKIPSIISTIMSIFNQAWGYSAIKEEGSNDEEKFNNKMLRVLTSFSMLIAIGILAITKPFLSVYVSESYYEAWKYVPFLLIGSTYMTLGTFVGTSYGVHKDSFGMLFSATFGAIFNIILNYILIPVIGVYGAAIATCISYILVFLFRTIHTRKYLHYHVLTNEFVVGTILLICAAIAIYIDNKIGLIIQWCIVLIAIVFYSKTWLPFLKEKINKNKQ